MKMKLNELLEEAIKEELNFRLIKNLNQADCYDLILENHHLSIFFPINMEFDGTINHGLEYAIEYSNDLESLLLYSKIFVLLNKIASCGEIIFNGIEK